MSSHHCILIVHKWKVLQNGNDLHLFYVEFLSGVSPARSQQAADAHSGLPRSADEHIRNFSRTRPLVRQRQEASGRRCTRATGSDARHAALHVGSCILDPGRDQGTNRLWKRGAWAPVIEADSDGAERPPPVIPGPGVALSVSVT